MDNGGYQIATIFRFHWTFQRHIRKYFKVSIFTFLWIFIWLSHKIYSQIKAHRR